MRIEPKTILKVGSLGKPSLLVHVMPDFTIKLINNMPSLSPDDVRELARALNKAADYIEDEISKHRKL